MKAALSLVAILASVASACKCIDYRINQPDFAATKKCCNLNHRNVEGDDCPANSIANNLSDFDYCCWGIGGTSLVSDCKPKHRRHPKDLQQ